MKKQAQLQVAASKDLVKAEKEALKKVREQIIISRSSLFWRKVLLRHVYGPNLWKDRLHIRFDETHQLY